MFQSDTVCMLISFFLCSLYSDTHTLILAKASLPFHSFSKLYKAVKLVYLVFERLEGFLRKSIH